MDDQILSVRPKKGFGFVYQYVSPSGKKYIGKTKTSLKERAGTKNGKGYKGCAAFYAAIQKYGWENFECSILKEVPLEYLDETEVQMILYYDTCNKEKGYNIVCYMMDWLASMNRIKVYSYDKKTGFFVKEYESIAEAERQCDVFHGTIRRTINHPIWNAKGYYWRTEKVDQIIIPQSAQMPHSKKVYMYDSLTGELVRTYSSIREATRETGYNRWTIQEHVSRKHVKRGIKYTFRDFKVDNLFDASSTTISERE